MSLRLILFISAGTNDTPGKHPFTVQGPDGIEGHGTYAVNCGKHASELNVSMDTPLPDEVRAYESMTLTWKFKKPQTDDWITRTTSHNVYVTYAAPLIYYPSNKVTHKRLSSVCKWAEGESTPGGVAMRIYQYLSTHEPPSPINLTATPVNYWGLMVPGSITECSGLANLMRFACGVVGVPASVGYVYATTDCSNYSSSPTANEIWNFQGEDHSLMYFAGDVNKWESVCLVNDGPPLNKNHYYGPKVTHNASSIEIIKSILGSNELTGNYQCWAHFVNGKWECNQSAPIPAGLPVQQCP